VAQLFVKQAVLCGFDSVSQVCEAYSVSCDLKNRTNVCLGPTYWIVLIPYYNIIYRFGFCLMFETFISRPSQYTAFCTHGFYYYSVFGLVLHSKLIIGEFFGVQMLLSIDFLYYHVFSFLHMCQFLITTDAFSRRSQLGATSIFATVNVFVTRIFATVNINLLFLTIVYAIWWWFRFFRLVATVVVCIELIAGFLLLFSCDFVSH